MSYGDICKDFNKKFNSLELDSNTQYNLYADEGGMFGRPRFVISTKKKKQDDVDIQFVLKGGKRTISNYIIGRVGHRAMQGYKVENYISSNSFITVK